jgi:enoyl-CoA hydratase
MSTEPILYRQEGGVGVLSLNRPDKLNAMTFPMGDAIEALVPRLNADPTLRCLVVRGEGRAFSAGGDLAFLEENSQRSPEENEATMGAFYRKFLTLQDVAVPTIALLQGRATGAGLCMALACDVRIAAEDALLSVNFVRVGLTPGMGGTWNLPRLIGHARASELFFTGRTVAAAEAVAMGLVNQVVALDALEATGMAMAEQIATAAPGAVRATKALLRGTMGLSLSDELDAEAQAQAVCFASADLREGIEAIRGKRAPEFKGK